MSKIFLIPLVFFLNSCVNNYIVKEYGFQSDVLNINDSKLSFSLHSQQEVINQSEGGLSVSEYGSPYNLLIYCSSYNSKIKEINISGIVVKNENDLQLHNLSGGVLLMKTAPPVLKEYGDNMHDFVGYWCSEQFELSHIKIQLELDVEFDGKKESLVVSLSPKPYKEKKGNKFWSALMSI